jgi:DNA-binding MarR family transcriptional regulator
MLFCDRPTATYILNTMRRYGWIESGKDPRNLKMRQVRLTAAGREKLNSLSGFRSSPPLIPWAAFRRRNGGSLKIF